MAIAASKTFKKAIEQLARREGVDLALPGAYLLFDMDGFQRLRIEVLAPGIVAVAHTFVQNGDLMCDPEIVFSTTTVEGWSPVECTQHPVGAYTVCAKVNERGEITHRNARAQRDILALVNVWARNLRAQRWLEDATCTRSKHGTGQLVGAVPVQTSLW
jgi:hypothetical protein